MSFFKFKKHPPKPPWRILFFGDRKWNDEILIRMTIKEIGLENIEVAIEGEAPGADKMCRMVLEDMGFPDDRILKFPANWTRFGNAAGPIRNTQMIREGKPNYGVGFHNDIANSKGTKNMKNQLDKAGIYNRIVKRVTR
jgi:hypothetical protein